MDMSRSRRQGPYTARATESSIIRTIVPSSAQGTVQESPQWMVIREENRRRWKNSPSMAPRSPPAAAYAAAAGPPHRKSGGGEMEPCPEFGEGGGVGPGGEGVGFF